MGQKATIVLVKSDDVWGWSMQYRGNSPQSPLPTVEDFRRDLEKLKKEVEQLLSIK